MMGSAPLPGNLKDALAEIEDLRQALAAGIEVAADEARQVERLQLRVVAERSRLRDLLARLEWCPAWDADDPYDDPVCPICGQNRSYGEHSPDCWLAAELHSAPKNDGGS